MTLSDMATARAVVVIGPRPPHAFTDKNEPAIARKALRRTSVTSKPVSAVHDVQYLRGKRSV